MSIFEEIEMFFSDKGSDEHEYGRRYAEWLLDENMPGAEAVNVDEAVSGSIDIPEEDYRDMVADGIDNPDPRAYWKGFNSVFEE